MKPSLSLPWPAEMESRAESEAELVAEELHLPASQSALGPARRYVEETATAFGFDADSCYELVFAVNEAVTNAIKHGQANEEGSISLSAIVEAERLTFMVQDSGTFAAPALNSDTSFERGRGLALMVTFTDEIRMSAKPGSTVVCLSKARV
jgi:anti-sigma regulatory factor (Ser/Thr protein kinase)